MPAVLRHELPTLSRSKVGLEQENYCALEVSVPSRPSGRCHCLAKADLKIVSM